MKTFKKYFLTNINMNMNMNMNINKINEVNNTDNSPEFLPHEAPSSN